MLHTCRAGLHRDCEAQGRSYLHTLGPKIGIVHIVGALELESHGDVRTFIFLMLWIFGVGKKGSGFLLSRFGSTRQKPISWHMPVANYSGVGGGVVL